MTLTTKIFTQVLCAECNLIMCEDSEDYTAVYCSNPLCSAYQIRYRIADHPLITLEKIQCSAKIQLPKKES